MAKPDLHVVKNDAPKACPLKMDTFAFVQTDTTTIVFHNGQCIDPKTATDRLVDIFAEAARKNLTLMEAMQSQSAITVRAPGLAVPAPEAVAPAPAQPPSGGDGAA